ncbi:XRE family transcriptional regulator [Mesonia maritima]|uniref:Phage repressor protein C with HTH and peptisase S24 domain n=1 Tax=Mesonia maritima TaxID=1793873 RepID=A0ABU1K4Y6_9FLAO|nr:LexA family transcriptional regulator [Mesonia maritima]MDR6300680.1 phage repressor protein C with HTH and peptisase S24 domain [Mesonia maritima]
METAIEIKRFKEVREENQFTQAEFAEKLGIKSSTADIERGRTKLAGTVVMELLRQFSINPMWLFGQSHQKHLNIHQVDTMPKVITVNSEEDENIMMVNQRAAAGYPHNIQDVEWYKQLPAFDFPLPQYRNATYRGFQVEGDSMLPNLRPDDWVLAKAIPSLAEATDHKIYVIVMYDTVVVKKLHKLTDPSKIRLVSLNEEYAPFEVKVSDIQEIWQVTSKLTFSLDANSENSMLKQLQQSMEELKAQLGSLKR